MVKFINKLEKRFGKYAIPNVSLYLVILYGLCYILSALNETVVSFLTLDPYAILHGQVWRLFSWIVITPPAGNIFFTLLTLYIFYSFGRNLEQSIGAFRYNLYLLSGMVFTVIGAFIFLIYCYLAAPELQDPEIASWFFGFYSHSFSTYYIYMSIFLAMAVIIPDLTVLLFFVLPIKMKYIAIIYGFILVLEIVGGNTASRIVIVSSLFNFLVFFFIMRGRDINRQGQKIKATVRNTANKQMGGQAKEKNAKAAPTVHVTGHKCAVCGVTPEMSPEREFRFCSKCQGSYEYCDLHIYTHEHVVKKMESEPERKPEE